MLDRPIAVLGGGNGAQCMAADLGLAGQAVNLYENPKYAATMARVFAEKKIELTGIGRTGTASLHMVTTNIENAVRDVQVVNLVVPASAHDPFFSRLVPHLRDDHVVVVWSGNFGSLRLLEVMREESTGAKPAVFETHTLPYGARLAEPGRVELLLSAPEVRIASAPGAEVEGSFEPLKEVFGCLVPADSVFETALNNPNPVVHPAGSLLNTGGIQTDDRDFYLYREGITEAVARVIREVHGEVAELARAMRVEMIDYQERDFQSTATIMGAAFRAPFDTVGVIADVVGPKSISDRYFIEDIPYGLVPIAELAGEFSVAAPLIRSIVDLGSGVCGRDFWEEGRKLGDLGLDGLGPDGLRELAESGRAPASLR